MSITEAAQLVLQAALMGGDNQNGEIFVLDMGEPVKIYDLAKDMIRLSGSKEEDIRIIFSGLRSGEKLYEELSTNDELILLPTSHSKLGIIKAHQSDKLSLKDLLIWLNQSQVLGDELVKQGLAKMVPEYCIEEINNN